MGIVRPGLPRPPEVKLVRQAIRKGIVTCRQHSIGTERLLIPVLHVVPVLAEHADIDACVRSPQTRLPGTLHALPSNFKQKSLLGVCHFGLIPLGGEEGSIKGFEIDVI